MEKNSSKININNPPKPTVLSNSRSISTISNHQKNISFMPKFLLNTLQRKKQSKHKHKHSVSMANAASMNDVGGENNSEIRRDKLSKINNHYFMQFIPIPKRVSSIVSLLMKSNKSPKKDLKPCLAKQLSEKGESASDEKKSKLTSSSLLSRSSKGRFLGRSVLSCNDSTTIHNAEKHNNVKVGEVVTLTMNGESVRRIKAAKGGLKIKGIVKIKMREKGEKRFELCKKKILMGEKCRPLNGTLRYDKNGVLVPENLTG